MQVYRLHRSWRLAPERRVNEILRGDKMVSFEISKADSELAMKAAMRAHKLAAANDIEYATMDAELDLEACHCNGTPLNFEKLLTFKDGDFGHDVFGIRRHIDRETGKLGDCFSPRCSL